MKAIRNRPFAPAFTLIELVISAALMAVILTGAYACLSAGFSGQRIVEPRADALQQARVALDRISADLRAACPLPRGAAFLGVRRLIGTIDADNLDFATHHYTPHKPGSGDFCEESLFVERDPKRGRCTLWRRRNPTMAFDPLSGGSREALATGLSGFRLEYFDGYDWYDSWGEATTGTTKSQMKSDKPNSSGLPEAVRISLALESDLPRTYKDQESTPALSVMVFQTVARLNLPTDGGAGNSTSRPSGDAPTTP